MFIRIGNAFINLNNVIHVVFDIRADDGVLVGTVETLASGATTTGTSLGPNVVRFEGEDARSLRQILEALAANGNDPEPLRAA